MKPRGLQDAIFLRHLSEEGFWRVHPQVWEPSWLIPCAAHVPPRCRGKAKNVCESHAGLRAGITHCIRNPKPKSAHKLVKSVQILLDSFPTPTKMEPKSTPDGPRRPLRDHLGAMFEKNLILKLPSGLWSSKMSQK